MKELSLYVCEVCGTQYSDKSACARCENGHRKNLRIVSSRYLSISQDKSGFPMTITIADKDGNTCIYKR